MCPQNRGKILHQEGKYFNFAIMKEIIFTNPHRKKHFDFFRSMSQPHFNICAPVDISQLLNWIKSENLPFTLTMVYCLSRIANNIPEFRRRIRGDSVWEHEKVDPSFTIETKVSDVFSFCHVPFTDNYTTFLKRGHIKSAQMQEAPIFEDEEGRDDLLFLSSLPWISFTGITHAMHCPSTDSVPRITWGKYSTEKNVTSMPLSVQVHHALVDGKQVGIFFHLLQELLDYPEKISTENNLF